MNYIQIALVSLEALLAQLLPNSGKTQEIDALIADIQAAIGKLQSVQGTDVTWQQLNELRTTAQW